AAGAARRARRHPVGSDLPARAPGRGAGRLGRDRAPLRAPLTYPPARMSERAPARPPVVVVTGPTSAGKTRVAIELALRLDGEIVNADSMQVYRFMDIGTAKPTLEQRARAPHHLLDVVAPDEPYHAGRYVAEARAAAARIHAAGRLVLLAGGTGLYIRA